MREPFRQGDSSSLDKSGMSGNGPVSVTSECPEQGCERTLAKPLSLP